MIPLDFLVARAGLQIQRMNRDTPQIKRGGFQIRRER
jgi:hypothetical protein